MTSKAKTFDIQPAEKISKSDVISKFIEIIKEDDDFSEKFEYVKEKKKKLEKFIKKGKSKLLNPPNQLIILRKFNSYTPILPPYRDDYLNKGGGYFLRLHHTGIVIDPGYNFVENFLSAGFKLDDIDHIFISHAHNDHTVELESIFALLHKRNKQTRKESTAKKIHLYLNLGTFKKFSGYFDLSNPTSKDYIKEITLLNKHQLIKIEDSIEVFTTQCKHHEMITNEYALGFTFRFNLGKEETSSIKFTCDTGWSTEIENKNRLQGLEFGIEKIDALIVHIGSIKEKELKYNVQMSLQRNENQNKLYENHLGLIGCVAEIDFWKPTLVLLSEFGEELDAIRDKIASRLDNQLKTPVFPTDLNFRVDLNSLKINCFKSKKFFPHDKITFKHKKQQIYFYNPDELDPLEKEDINSHLGDTITVYP